MAELRKPLLNKAIRFITDYLQGDRLPESGRLPSLRQMAAEAGVSLFTMSRAARQLSSEGIIDIAENSGIWKAGHAGRKSIVQKSSTAYKPSPRKWHLLREEILKDIYADRFKPGAMLPTAKELTLMYNTSRKTMRKALDALTGERLLQPSGRGLKVRSFARTHSNTTAVLVTPFNIGIVARHTFKLIEEVCGANNVALKIAEINLQHDRLEDLSQLQRDIASICRAHSVIGFFLIPGRHPSRADLLDRILQVLEVFNLPVSIIGTGGTADLTPNLKKYSSISFHNYNWDQKPGMIMGQYLREMGHRRIAYISRLDSFYWSPDRCLGLTDVISRADRAPRVRMYLIRDRTFAPQEVGQKADLFRVAPWIVEHSGLRPEQYPKIESPHYHPEYRGKLPDVIPVASAKEAVDLILKQNDITAIVGENDDAALEARAILVSRGIRIPADISLVGFDNTLDSLTHGMTSYAPNDHGIASTGLNYLLNYSRQRKSSNRIFGTEGVVIMRESVASL